MDGSVRVFPDAEALSLAAAETFVACAQEAVAARGRFLAALSGGRTPRRLYELLGSPAFAGQVDWSRVHLFWGDERYVPYDDPQSNFRMVRETLLAAVPIPAEQVHPMPTGLPDASAAAETYAKTLERYLGQDPLDLALLGMGADGHTASLFPATWGPTERRRTVVAVQAPIEPPLRLSLTMPVLTDARLALFLVTGADKRPVLAEVLADPAAAARIYPAARVAAEGNARWFLDRSCIEA